MAKTFLEMQPHLTRKEMLDSPQNLFEENENHAERELSALAAQYTEHNKDSVRFSKSRQNRDSSWSPTRHSNLNANGQETCYICNGLSHHTRHCEFRQETRRYGEILRLEKESKNRQASSSKRPSIRSNSRKIQNFKSVKFSDNPKAFWSETEAGTESE
ncbi:hypothetical protein GcM3_106032 [Golovinomyces cichoracearum]|uniref:Uncharacterized protein n=1 Tax=Golovinomyces cichoracearum TaxID=62708 RepID=A0A420I9N6_9PEZI|nr:hypothetical protein GcM3_106032 [Golovinomyces cichoracearum]